MDFVKLGQTGLDVSRLCLGCMTFGDPDAGAHPWTLGEDDSRPIIKRAVDLGINFFDTANSYSAGTSERIVGKLLGEFTRRDRDRHEGLFPRRRARGGCRPQSQGPVA
jgi:aryl-alcohol dehydrogenase-like predicted oxidoreductase